MTTLPVVLVNVPNALEQVVVGAGELWMVKPLGSESVKPD